MINNKFYSWWEAVVQSLHNDGIFVVICEIDGQILTSKIAAANNSSKHYFLVEGINTIYPNSDKKIQWTLFIPVVNKSLLSNQTQIQKIKVKLNSYFASINIDNTEITVTDKIKRTNHRLLTEREGFCLSLIAKGETSKTIANKLGKSTSVVNFHLRNCKIKLGTNKITEAVAIGIKRGLINN